MNRDDYQNATGLSVYICKIMPNLGRNGAKALIKNGRVCVNGKVITSTTYPVWETDVVEIKPKNINLP